MWLLIFILSQGLLSQGLLTAHAQDPHSTQVHAKAASRGRPLRVPAYARALRATLEQTRAINNPADMIYAHQLRNPEHRAYWLQQFKTKGLSVLGRWIGTSPTYPGLWTMEDNRGWYDQSIGGAPVRFTMKKGALFIDLEDPAQMKIYEQWKQHSGWVEGDPHDLFQRLKDVQGTPLARKVTAVWGPSAGRFLQELNIAGVIWGTAYGRSPILLNPDAVESVTF